MRRALLLLAVLRTAQGVRLHEPSKVIIPIGSTKLPAAPEPAPVVEAEGGHADNTFSEAARDALKEKHAAGVAHGGCAARSKQNWHWRIE